MSTTFTTRRLTWACFLAILLFAFSANALPAALLRAAADFGIDFSALARVGAIQFAGFFTAAIIGGVLADRYGKPRLMQGACALVAAGAIVWSLASGRPIAAVGAGLMGLGGGILESMGCALLCDIHPTRRKFYMNVSQVLYCAGAVIGPLCMAWLLPQGISWRWFFGGIAACATVPLVLFLSSDAPRLTHDERIHWPAFRIIARRPRFWILAAVLFLYVLTEATVGIFANAYLQTVLGAPESWAICTISVLWATVAIGRLACAHVPERIPSQYMIIALLILSAGALLGFQWITDWRWGLALVGLTGLAFAGTWPLIVELATVWNPRYSGTVLGITIACGALGCIASPLLFGALFSRIASSSIFPLFGLSPLLGAALLLGAARLNPPGDIHSAK